MKLSEAQKDDMRHALGLNQTKRGESYRNFYSADADGPDAASWRELVAAGYATERPFAAAKGMVLFAVTTAGRQALDSAE